MSRRSSDWRPLDSEQSQRQIVELLEMLGSPPRTVLDLGCGDGRVMLPLVLHGHHVTGWDHDPAAIAAARTALRRLGVNADDPRARTRLERRNFLAAWTGLRRRFDAVIMLGRTLMTVTTHDHLATLFGQVAKRLTPGGLFVVDDFSTELWREVASGRWREGVSRDGRMQLVWQPGEAIVAVRQGRRVNRRHWAPTRSDQRLRLWTTDDLNHHARSVDLRSAPLRTGSTLRAWSRSGKVNVGEHRTGRRPSR